MGNQTPSHIMINAQKCNRSLSVSLNNKTTNNSQVLNLPCSIIDSNKQIIVLNNHKNKSADLIFQQSQQFNHIKLRNKKPSNHLWRFLLPRQKKTLSQNDVMKIGSYQISVKQIAFRSRSKKSLGQKTTVQASSRLQTDCMEDSAFFTGRSRMAECRICFQSYNSSDNPLLNPCDCQGSVKFIHFQCLRDWISINFVKKIQKPGLIRYKYDGINCDLCKKQIPRQIETAQAKLDLVMRQKFLAPYITLQVASNVTQKNIYMFQLHQDQQISIGNNSTNNLILNVKIQPKQQFCTLKYTNRTVEFQVANFSQALAKVRGNVQIKKNQITSFCYNNYIIGLYEQELTGNFLQLCFSNLENITISYEQDQN